MGMSYDSTPHRIRVQGTIVLYSSSTAPEFISKQGIVSRGTVLRTEVSLRKTRVLV